VDKVGVGIVSLSDANELNNVYNNAIINCSVGLIPYLNVANCFNNVKNNIFYNNTTHINTYSGNITSIDYNDYYGTGNWYWGGVSRATFALWETASSADTNGLNADPLFTNAGGSYLLDTDFILQAGSPCINVGTDVSLTSDYFGNAIVGTVDMGAVEKQ
jgi:hypothetical protein